MAGLVFILGFWVLAGAFLKARRGRGLIVQFIIIIFVYLRSLLNCNFTATSQRPAIDRTLALRAEMESWKVKSCVRVQKLCRAWKRIYSTGKCRGSRAVFGHTRARGHVRGRAPKKSSQ